jgi:hypothetical protein
VFRLAGSQYLVVAADADGGVTSEVLGIRLRVVPGEKPRLRIEDLREPGESAEI